MGRWPGCGMKYPYAERARHEREACRICLKRAQVLGAHEERFELLECPVGCGESFHRKDMDQHKYVTDRQRRPPPPLVARPDGGCGLLLVCVAGARSAPSAWWCARPAT